MSMNGGRLLEATLVLGAFAWTLAMAKALFGNAWWGLALWLCLGTIFRCVSDRWWIEIEASETSEEVVEMFSKEWWNEVIEDGTEETGKANLMEGTENGAD
jgi:hypothetical protein